MARQKSRMKDDFDFLLWLDEHFPGNITNDFQDEPDEDLILENEFEGEIFNNKTGEKGIGRKCK